MRYVLSRVLSVKALGVGEFARVGKIAACCQVWPQEVVPPGQDPFLAFWTVPETARSP